MTFASLQFLLVFLPLCYAGFLLVHRGLGWHGVYAYLVVASLLFYAQFSLTLTLVLMGSIVTNFVMGRAILATVSRARKRTLVIVAVTGNLCALGYFKYTDFFIDIVNTSGGFGFGHLGLIVPVGISFYTFTQIGFLIEAGAGTASRVSLPKYALFAGFFPCVTAGPLLLQREFLGQLEDREDKAFMPARVAVGLTMFGIGLAKKVIIADAIAPYANVVFDGVAGGAPLGIADAWIGALAYTLQLYFDFSGYSDMAIGIAFLFGLRLPLNFNSPFKATSISDFWNRWHITMTRFFTTFLFTRMAMSNARRAMQKGHGRLRKWLAAGALPIFYTFVVAGIWHGAGWTFVVFGLIHGTALAVNHGWREWSLPSPGPYVGWTLTMLVVVSGLVVFRAPDMATALTVLGGMWGAGQAAEPLSLAAGQDLRWVVSYLVVGWAMVLTLPNSQQILRSNWLSSDQVPEDIDRAAPLWLTWRPSAAWAAAVALLLVISASSIGDAGRFLYYDF